MFFAVVEKCFKNFICVLKRNGDGAEIIVVFVFTEHFFFFFADVIVLKCVSKCYFEKCFCFVIFRLFAEFGKGFEKSRGYVRIAVKQHTVKVPDVILHNQSP